MGRNFFIGIGGTGARVAEALIHSCAIGFGPPELFMFLIDPDKGNGNLDRTRTLLGQYEAAHNAFLQRSDSGRVCLFSTRIVTPKRLVWNVLGDANETLARFIRFGNLSTNDRPLADFVNLLFSEKELETELNEGFRGHPSIGAVVMAEPDEDDDPWKSFWDGVKKNEGHHDARVFLAGSIFGGTGAAGVPTFGSPKMIKFHQNAKLDDAGTRSRVLLGGALILPYFTFESPEAERADREMFVSWADFPIATRAALQFYDTKLKHGDLAFDDLYFIGDSIKQNVGTFSPGNVGQCNKPHYVEFAAALSAVDFFVHQRGADDPQKFFLAARPDAGVTWDGLPVTRDSARVDELKALLRLRAAALLTFMHAFRTYGEPILQASHDDVRDRWYQRHFRDADPREPESRRRLDAITKMAEVFASWIADVSTDEAGRVKLVDPARVHTEEREQIGSMLGKSSKHLPFADFLNMLNQDSIHVPPSMVPSDRIVNLFYEAAVDYAAANYAIDPTVASREL